jgi:predicted dithiol-disulfide oxidoreductase (DUF899 family)
MNLPEIVSREQWLAARKQLLAREKELTRVRDELAADRRRLPMVEVHKPYVFEGSGGPASLLDLFDECRQLIVYHFMWRDDLDNACPSCSGFGDEVARGHLTFLRERDTRLVFISRAPAARLEAFWERMGWLVPWYSSEHSEFNYDFQVTFDESVAPIEYNFFDKAALLEREGMAWLADANHPFDMPGLSCFLREEQRVFHTYSTYARGTEAVGGPHYFLDLTALGRQESWEEPKGRVTGASTIRNAPLR